MQKIPTMFERDESVSGHPVTDRLKPECAWVFSDADVVATVKLDGTNVKVEGGQLMKRQKPKNRDYDEASYVPCLRNNKADQWAFEAFDREPFADGIYELLGPKVQGNPHGFRDHRLMRVVPLNYSLACRQAFGVDVPRTFEGLRAFFGGPQGALYEGIVFHHETDGRMAKIKRRDFGLPWPVRVSATTLAAVDPVLSSSLRGATRDE